jgi:hypothetical protein
MATVSLKNVPEELCAELKRRAARHRRSLNQELLYCLELFVGFIPAQHPEDYVWLDESGQALMKVWDNTGDDIYNELLKK